MKLHPFLFLAFSSLAFAADTDASFLCRAEDKTVYEVTRGKCDNGYCKLEIALTKDHKVVSRKTSENMITIFDGKIDNSDRSGWWVSREGAEESEGKKHLAFKTGKTGSHSALLLVTTQVAEGEGLPIATYAYYTCENDKLNLAWEGADEGNAAMSTVALEDVDKDGTHEITIKGGSFCAGGKNGLKTATFAWNPKTKKMAFQKTKAPSGK